MKGREGPSRCYLCQNENESNFHIAVKCEYTRKVWSKIEFKLNKQNLWNEDSVESCLKEWSANDDLIEMRSLPLIVSWGVWLSINYFCFEYNLFSI